MTYLIKSGDYSEVFKNIISTIQGNKSTGSIAETLPDSLEGRAQQRVSNEDILHQQNMEDVLKGAAERLSAEAPNNPLQSIDPDWYRIVMNDVKDISNGEMKQIWSKLVAGEILRPKSYSLRAVQLLRSLSKDDAEIITKIAPFTISDDSGKRMIIHGMEDNSKWFKFDDLLFLDELRLLETSSMVEMNWDFTNQVTDYSNCVMLNNGNVGINIFTNVKHYSIPVYTLTVIGNQIFSLIEGIKPNVDYFKSVLGELVTDGSCVC